MKLLLRLKLAERFLCCILLLSMAFAGCKKPKAETPDEPEPIPTTSTRTQLTQDSIYLYAKEVYLWYDALPSYEVFNPRKYTQQSLELANLNKELFDITQRKINTATGKPYEFSAGSAGTGDGSPKYSYITDITTKNPVSSAPGTRSSVDLEGNGFDFGFRAALVWINQTENKFGVILEAVYQNSPAAKAGLERGDIITNINDRNIGPYSTAELNLVNTAIFGSANIRLKGVKRGKTLSDPLFDKTLNKENYKSSPIYKDSVYTAGALKIGYMSYARFSNPANSLSELNRVFESFAAKGVTDLIIDLRYNGGGYVSTAEHLINLIAPTSLNGKVMYVEHYNDLMQKGKATILQKQPLEGSPGNTYADVDYSISANTNHFSKKGSLNNVARVVFIVTESSASASELVINSLRPHFPVTNLKVVGKTSYGKPVGFFPIRIDKYDVFFSMFETKNSKGEGGYYAGITPDTGTSTADDDTPFYDFGDIKDPSTAAAYNYLTKGTYTSSVNSATISSIKTTSNRGSSTFTLKSDAPILGDTEFKGMIETRYKLKK